MSMATMVREVDGEVMDSPITNSDYELLVAEPVAALEVAQEQPGERVAQPGYGLYPCAYCGKIVEKANPKGNRQMGVVFCDLPSHSSNYYKRQRQNKLKAKNLASSPEVIQSQSGDTTLQEQAVEASTQLNEVVESDANSGSNSNDSGVGGSDEGVTAVLAHSNTYDIQDEGVTSTVRSNNTESDDMAVVTSSVAMLDFLVTNNRTLLADLCCWAESYLLQIEDYFSQAKTITTTTSADDLRPNGDIPSQAYIEDLCVRVSEQLVVIKCLTTNGFENQVPGYFQAVQVFGAELITTACKVQTHHQQVMLLLEDLASQTQTPSQQLASPASSQSPSHSTLTLELLLTPVPVPVPVPTIPSDEVELDTGTTTTTVMAI